LTYAPSPLTSPICRRRTYSSRSSEVNPHFFETTIF
jgi:hypothetical protein